MKIKTLFFIFVMIAAASSGVYALAASADVGDPKYGGQTLILVISDIQLGRPSEIAQRLPIISRADYYRYDKIINLDGAQVATGALEKAAQEAYLNSKVVDVLIFAHGIDSEIILRTSRHNARFLSAKDLAQELSPLKDKFRMFYTAACDFANNGQYIASISGAAVAISHAAINITPLSFPLKFLKYFKLGVDGQGPMNAGEAARKALDYAYNNPNPAMRVLFQPIANAVVNATPNTDKRKVEAKSFWGSSVMISGSTEVKGSDLDLSTRRDPQGLIRNETLYPNKKKLSLRDVFN